jgi:peptide/nickel transport system substrate-binding protein
MGMVLPPEGSRGLGSGERMKAGSGIKRALIAFVVAVALATAGCTSASNNVSNKSVKEGGTLRIATSEGIDSLNPFVGFNQDDFNAWMYMYPSLLQFDTTSAAYDYMGNFATKWQQSADGLTWTFETTPNAKWSDGQALNAEDVAWTFNMIMKYQDGPTAAWAGSVAFLKSVTAPSPNTVVFTYGQPFGIALFNLGLTPILPPQVWQKYATGDGKDLKTFPNQPENGDPLVGGGPFILAQYRKNDIALFTKNPNFYGPKPHMDSFGLQFFESQDAMVTALKSGQIDAIEATPPTSVQTLTSAGLHVYQGPALVLRDFIINVDPHKTQHRELLNPQVRQAFEYAIDRNSIVKTAWLGYALPGTSIIPTGNATGGMEWHNPNVKSLPFDVTKANQILDSLGYAKGGNGIRVANGEPMDYTVVFPHAESGTGDRAFQIIQQDFKQIGVQLSQKRLDDSAAWDAMYCGEKCGYDYDLAMWDWYPAADPDFMLSVLTCDQYGNWNDSGYCNPEYDSLYKQQQGAVNPKDRQKIVWQMQQLAYNDRPYIILTYDKRLDAWSKNWTGFIESPQGFFNNFSIQSLTAAHQA